VPSAINYADGGIDAEVREVPIEGGQGLIRSGDTRYQIKTGNFRLIEQENINKILFTPRSLRRGATRELQPRVKSCFDKSGTLALVLFGWDEPETTDDQVLQKIRKTLREAVPAYESAKIDIFRQNNLRGFLKPFPSLALRLTARDSIGFYTHEGWSRLSDLREPFFADEKQMESITHIQGRLRNTEAPIHVRVLGEPGIGKTRLVLEALREQDLAPLVVYYDSPEAFRHSQLMTDLHRDDNTYSVVLVVDDCPPEDSRDFWRQLQYARASIRLITLYNDEEPTTGSTVRVNAQPVAAETVAQIIQSYGVSELDTARWVELCGGSPRVAHVIGANLRSNPQDVLREPDTSRVWERFIAGATDLHSAEVDQRRVVLRYLALFKRFGFQGRLVSEAQKIAEMVREARPEITWPRFQEIVRTLRQRRVLQGEHTLYITPKALHVWLWRDWWDTYGSGFDLNGFEDKLSPTLLVGQLTWECRV
jgi:hypothetical protein